MESRAHGPHHLAGLEAVFRRASATEVLDGSLELFQRGQRGCLAQRRATALSVFIFMGVKSVPPGSAWSQKGTMSGTRSKTGAGVYEPWPGGGSRLLLLRQHPVKLVAWPWPDTLKGHAGDIFMVSPHELVLKMAGALLSPLRSKAHQPSRVKTSAHPWLQTQKAEVDDGVAHIAPASRSSKLDRVALG